MEKQVIDKLTKDCPDSKHWLDKVLIGRIHGTNTNHDETFIVVKSRRAPDDVEGKCRNCLNEMDLPPLRIVRVATEDLMLADADTIELYNRLDQVKDSLPDAFWNRHRNLGAITMGRRVKGGQIDPSQQQLCIVFKVTHKGFIPSGEQDFASDEQLASVKEYIDVRERLGPEDGERWWAGPFTHLV